MARLIYSALASLDGYIEDKNGKFDWAEPNEAIKAGLVDEYHLFLAPVVVGGGKRALPEDALVKLELLDERRFGNGVAYLHYRTRT